MKKKLLSLGISAILALAATAQDVDYTSLIKNNSFEYAWENQLAEPGIDGWITTGSGTWRPFAATDENHQKFYGWNVTDWSIRAGGGNSQSLDKSANATKVGDFNIVIYGNGKIGSLWELSQVISKDDLPAGIYKVQARLAVNVTGTKPRLTSQRLFANQSVQYHGPQTTYTKNLTTGEVNTFAGYPGTDGSLDEMTVYTTIGENDSLKIGIRTGCVKPDGTFETGNIDPFWGCFKADYFRITRMSDNTDYVPFTKLTSLSLKNGGLTLIPAFNPEIKNYTVYLPEGTTTVTPIATAPAGGVITGNGEVTLNGGSGTSTILVTAPNGTTIGTYTINYIVYTFTNAVDCSNLITNNSFEYAWENQLAGEGDAALPANGWKNGNTWRPKYTANTSIYNTFYGWEVTDWSMRNGTNDAQSLEKDGYPKDQNFDIAIMGNNFFSGELWEMYQVIDKNALSAGTYKVQARLAVDGPKQRTTQRLFANNKVQYHGTEEQYVNNKYLLGNEVATFAGYSGIVNVLEEMKVYVTIGEDDDLMIGIRSGNKKTDGTFNTTATDPVWGGFKADYFRLIKIDPAQAADATLSGITLNPNATFVPNFSPQTTSYNVQLPVGTNSVTPMLLPTIPDAKITGVGAVDVSSGSGVSTIEVTALNGTTKKIYTINYSAGPVTGFKEAKAVDCTYSVVDRRLSVFGVDAYSVYSINGVKIADVRNNAERTIVALAQGIYIVKTANNQTLKVIVR